MSLSSSTIERWTAEGKPWTFSNEPKEAPVTLAPNEVRALPSKKYIWKAPEGALIHMAAFFDDPAGGVGMESGPNLNWRNMNTVQNYLAGGRVLPNNFLYAMVPPYTPQGIYGIEISKEWPWRVNAKIYVLNSSTTRSIRCLGYAYTMIYLKGGG